MGRRFTDSEVALARRIKANQDRLAWERAMQAEQKTLRETFQEICNAPLQPSYGPTPPWWEQAVAEADQDLVWVNGGGWMRRDLWEDILKYAEDLKDG